MNSIDQRDRRAAKFLSCNVSLQSAYYSISNEGNLHWYGMCKSEPWTQPDDGATNIDDLRDMVSRSEFGNGLPLVLEPASALQKGQEFEAFITRAMRIPGPNQLIADITK